MNLLVYTSPGRLQAAMATVIAFYNYRRYHEGLDNVMAADVDYGRREAHPRSQKGAAGSHPRTTARVQPRPFRAAHTE